VSGSQGVISYLLDLQFFIDLHQNIHYRELQAFGQDKPLISSECPGWICYVEKVVKDPVISLCSRVKTPQMLAGEIMKRLFVESGYV
jgi:iron only hydrogenase large subunit-like protein